MFAGHIGAALAIGRAERAVNVGVFVAAALLLDFLLWLFVLLGWESVAVGFKAMQFNFVVATNTRAVRLWERLGFSVVGRLPGAFNHQRLGYVDALIMFKRLAP